MDGCFKKERKITRRVPSEKGIQCTVRQMCSRVKMCVCVDAHPGPLLFLGYRLKVFICVSGVVI